MGGFRGQNWELDSFHAYCCKYLSGFEQILHISCSEFIVMLQQVKLLFAGERVVCDQIFEGFETLADQCFSDVTASSVSVLLSFGDAIAKSKRSPEKLFVLLDMYEIMRELHSEVFIRIAIQKVMQ